MKKIFFILGIGILGATLSLFLGVSFAEAQLLAPTSPSPSDGATAEQPVILKWSQTEFPAEIAGGYLLELRGGTLGIITTWAETNSYKITQALLGTEHLWRVRACFGFDKPANPEEVCGPWSNSGLYWKFIPTLAKPILLSPPNTTKQPVSLDPTTKSLKLEWEKVVGADKYLLTLRKLSDGFTRVFEVRDPSKLVPDTFVWVNGSFFPLDLQNSFAWKVSAQQRNTIGPESDEWKFFLTLPRPTLRLPSTNTDVPYQVPLFTWDPVFKATSYVLEVFNTANVRIVSETFTNPAVTPQGISVDALKSGNINRIGETYSWRVTACERENVNCGPSSSRFNFTLIFFSPTITSPSAGNQPLTIPFTFEWTKPIFVPTGTSVKYFWEIVGQIPAKETAATTATLDQQLKPGTYTFQVKACAPDNKGCSDWSKRKFNVPLSELTIAPSFMEVLVGKNQQFEASLDPDGPTGSQTPKKTTQATWSSTNSSVASVDNTGLATCKTSGNANITATLQALSATATLACREAEAPVIEAPVIVSSISGILEVSSTDPILFGSVQPEKSITRNRALVLLNVSSSSATATILVSGNGFKLISPSSATLSPEEDQPVNLQFTAPSAAEEYRGTVEVHVSVGGEKLGFYVVALRASVESPPPTGTGAPTAPGKPTLPSGPSKTISDVADRAANLAFTALLIAASLFVLLAAFQFATGGGNPEMISQAKDKLIWAAVGIGIALVAKGVARILQNILLPPGEPGAGPCPDLAPSGDGIQNPLKTICFSGLLDSILNVIFTLSLIVVPFVVIYAGFLFVTGGGNPAQITRARDTLIWTAVGFGVILISKGLPVILRQILGI